MSSATQKSEHEGTRGRPAGCDAKLNFATCTPNNQAANRTYTTYIQGERTEHSAWRGSFLIDSVKFQLGEPPVDEETSALVDQDITNTDIPMENACLFVPFGVGQWNKVSIKGSTGGDL